VSGAAFSGGALAGDRPGSPAAGASQRGAGAPDPPGHPTGPSTASSPASSIKGPPSGAPISIRGVSKSFAAEKGETVTLTDFSLEVKAGEFVCLLGPSGCGKSTLLNLIAGLDFPSRGEVVVGGKPVTGPGRDRTVMFQDAALFPWLNLRKNVAFPLELAGVPASEVGPRVERALRMVHLWRFADAPIHTLSGGMRQRGALARALVCEPGTLLMDEPFAALDAQTRDVLYGELENVWLSTGKTVVFVTHNVREAVRLGDRIVVLATRPGRLRKVVDVELPRPRPDADRNVSLLAAVVMNELREEIARVQREEADDAWEMGAAPGPPDNRFGMGGGL
jgi:NitT/TauT family transport system ATP-binding protein